jgi:hypothetical protein
MLAMLSPEREQFRSRRSASDLPLVVSDEGDVRPAPFFYQPNPDKPFFVSAKAEKLVCRGPREYYMVGKMPDGSEAEAQLTAVRWDELRSLATFRITRPS